MKITDWIGWCSSLVLLVTIARQVYTQWRDGPGARVSKWLFVGQVTASTGFAIYSWLLHNWVFLVSNLALLVTAVIGEWILIKNQQAEQGGDLSQARRGS